MKNKYIYYWLTFVFIVTGIWFGFHNLSKGNQNQSDKVDTMDDFYAAQQRLAESHAYDPGHKELLDNYMQDPKAFLPERVEQQSSEKESEEAIVQDVIPSADPLDVLTYSQTMYFGNTAKDFSVYNQTSYRDTRSKENREVLNTLSNNVLARANEK